MTNNPTTESVGSNVNMDLKINVVPRRRDVVYNVLFNLFIVLLTFKNSILYGILGIYTIGNIFHDKQLSKLLKL